MNSMNDCPYNEGTYHYNIYRLVKKHNVKKCLEIGTDVGNSTEAIIRAMSSNGGGHLVSIDCSACISARDRVRQYENQLTRCSFITSYSLDAFEGLANNKYDLVYIDGNHDVEAVRSDWLTFGKLSPVVLFDVLQLHGPRTVFEEIKQMGDFETEEYLLREAAGQIAGEVRKRS